MVKKKDSTTIKISKELKERLNALGRKGDTYEDIIWRLLKAFEEREPSCRQAQ